MAVQSSERRLERTCEGTASAPLCLPSLWSELAEARDVEGRGPASRPRWLMGGWRRGGRSSLWSSAGQSVARRGGALGRVSVVQEAVARRSGA